MECRPFYSCSERHIQLGASPQAPGESPYRSSLTLSFMAMHRYRPSGLFPKACRPRWSRSPLNSQPVGVTHLSTGLSPQPGCQAFRAGAGKPLGTESRVLGQLETQLMCRKRGGKREEKKEERKRGRKEEEERKEGANF